MKKYSRVTYEDRCHISAYLEIGISINEIAKRLNFHRSTVYREIRRNKSIKHYKPRYAQDKAVKRYKESRMPIKFKNELKWRTLKYLKCDWSPQQIVMRFRLEKYDCVSHETIYRYIRKNKAQFKPHLRRMRYRGGWGRIVQKRRKANKYEPNISERPESADQRSEFGHIERDVFFAGSTMPILVCLDRKSRLIKISKTKDLKAKTVNELTMKLVNQMPFKVKTITSDRGSEFKVHIEGVPTYYCDPQAPQQRGSVENVIGLIRQYIKRKTDHSEITTKRIKEIEDKLNNRPRKILDYKTPNEVVNGTVVALVS